SFVNNVATAGFAGGVFVNAMPVNSAFKVLNSTFAGDSSATSGGAIRLGGNSTDFPNTVIASLDSDTFANNTESDGAIEHCGGTIYIESCIFDGNNGIVPNVSDFDNTAGATFVTNSLYNPSTVSIPSGVQLLTGNILDTMANLGSLADNGHGDGAPRLTMVPQVGSPVIDTGSNPTAATYDERGLGFAR